MQPATRVLARLFGTDDFALFQVFTNRFLRIPLSDYYWITPLLTGGEYEPEISFILTKIMRTDSTFIDCGANIGWWSVFASTILPRREQVLAIEASPSIFTRLAETAALNDDRFLCLNAAVWNETGLPIAVAYHPVLHGASTIKEPSGPGFQREETTSIRIDDAVEERLRSSSGRIVLKLDVEGAEVEALQGAERLLDERTLLIYEDHGKHIDPIVSKTVVAMGFSVFYCDAQLQVHEMNTLDNIVSVRRNPRKGYNFLACRPGTVLHRELVELGPRAPEFDVT